MYRFSLFENDTVLESRIVSPLSTIEGAIVLSGLPQNAYVQIYGLERLARTDSVGRFTIDDLPAGKMEDGEWEYKLRVISIQRDGTQKVFMYELEIKPGVNSNNISIELDDD